MKKDIKAVRSAIAFFLMTFSTAYLFTIGVRLTGGFTRAPEIPVSGLQSTGLSIPPIRKGKVVEQFWLFVSEILHHHPRSLKSGGGGVAVLIVGAGIRRLTAAEMQSALLGASAVLLATPVASAVLNNDWSLATAVVSGFGIVTLAFGLLIAWLRKSESNADEI